MIPGVVKDLSPDDKDKDPSQHEPEIDTKVRSTGISVSKQFLFLTENRYIRAL